MADFQRSNIRVSDTEREDAIGKLSEHMSSGRLDIDEYGERTAKVAAAKTRADVLDVFDDLPEPRPAFGRPAPPATPQPAPAPRGPSVVGQVVPVVAPILAIALGIGLILLVKLPFFILIPIIFFAVSGSQWGRYDRRRRYYDRYNRRVRGRWRDEIR